MKKCPLNILLVEDDEMVRRVLTGALKEYRVEQASCCSEALLKAGSINFQVALVDLMLPDKSGLEVLWEIKKLQPHCQVIMMTGHGTIPSAVRSIRIGAYDYIEKPFSLGDIRQLVKKAVRSSNICLDVTLPEEIHTLAGRLGLVGYNSREMQKLLATAYKISGKNISVLICGETGAGKELLARFIHAASSRANMMFLPVNCGALAESIMDSELFGHEKGAFTGADRRRQGYFELADKGTIFLDEVSEASSGLQAKLLRVLETGEFLRVGGEKIVSVDVRVVAATNVELKNAVRKKLFREDLYYRIGAVCLNVPPLRQRKKDILPLAEHFLRRIASSGSGEIQALSPEVAEVLLNYSWPGNVRELANVIQQAAVMAEGPVILPVHLPAYLFQSERFRHKEIFQLNDDGRPPRLEDIEKAAIISALRYCRGNIKAAASVLAIGRATMHRKIKEYGIDPKLVYRIEASDYN